LPIVPPRGACCAVIAGLVLLSPIALRAQAPAALPKGHRLLIEHGLQIQGMATKDDVFHLATYRDANYTAINWLFESNVALHGEAPGFAWARWVGDEAQMPPRAGQNEERYMPQLVALSLGDEKDLNNPAVRDPYVQWFKNIQSKYPTTILYANNFGGQVNDAALSDFTARAKPDMLAFDTYPWKSNYTTRKPEPPAGGSPTNWYGDLRRYREHARAANVPLATYRQSFHAVQDYDATVYRDPSASEFRLNTFAALAFNVKFIIDFTYNTGASSFFTKPGGDSHPTPLYRELKQVNREARALGQALVYLKPIEDAESRDRFTTGVMFIRGQHQGAAGAPALNAIPVGLVQDPADPGYTDWESGRNDPYLRGWSVVNSGSKNNKLPGDVIISWFKVLDETLDGEQASGELYLMITNGLCDGVASAADCRQTITVNFADAPATETMQKLDRNTGRVVDVPLSLTNKRRQLVLELDGGTAELFKFKTGAPFVGVAGNR
jgi:hypothetical protein